MASSGLVLGVVDGCEFLLKIGVNGIGGGAGAQFLVDEVIVNRVVMAGKLRW